MKWSKDKPIVNGFFWYKKNKTAKPEICELCYVTDPRIESTTYWTAFDNFTYLDKVNGLWCGPIFPPK